MVTNAHTLLVPAMQGLNLENINSMLLKFLKHPQMYVYVFSDDHGTFYVVTFVLPHMVLMAKKNFAIKEKQWTELK
jgi:hypothetical protein